MGFPHRLTDLCTTVLAVMAFGQIPARLGVLHPAASARRASRLWPSRTEELS
jgi:hypothetical protein